MADAARLRDRATRVLALALQVRDNGNVDYANELTRLAEEAFLTSHRDRDAQSKLAVNARTRSA
jgi:hypothetical protein